MLRKWLLTDGMLLSSYLGFPLGKAIKLFRDSEYWSREELYSHQAQSVNALLRHCFAHVPYYRHLMISKNLTPDDFQSPSDLAKLPYLTKDIVRTHAARLRADNYPDNVCQFRRSGGTTGEPVRVAADIRARAFEVAAYLRGFGWMNYQMGKPIVRLFGGSLGLGEQTGVKQRLREWLLNRRFLPAFELTPQNVDDYVFTIQAAKGGVLVGYASAAFNLAEYMAMRGYRGSPLESVICTAEYMPEQWKARIQEVLDVPVFCYYGCGEVTGVAHECSGEEGYLVSQEHVVVEVANDNAAEYQDQGIGEACITPLFNYAMPLVRYLNGDMFELKYLDGKHSHLRITQLQGRVMDQLLRTDGTLVSSVLPTHLIYRSGVPVWKYQAVQTERKTIIFHYLLQNGDMLNGEMRDILRRVFTRYLGDGLHVEFVVGNFEMSKSGKHRFVINRVLEQWNSTRDATPLSSIS